MRRPDFRADWPASWRTSYDYDKLEVFDGGRDAAYATAYRIRRRRTLELIESAASPPARVLDVAAAQGNLTLTLAERGYHVAWNDLRAELAGYVELKRERGHIDYLPGNLFELDTEPFDIVVAGEVIEHVAHPDELVATIASLVRPGGHVVLTTPNGGYFRNPLPRFSSVPDPSTREAIQFQPDASGHLWLLSDDELERFAETAGLEIRRLDYFTSPLAAGWLGTRRLARLVPAPVVDAVEAGLAATPNAVQRRVATHLAVLLRRPS